MHTQLSRTILIVLLLCLASGARSEDADGSAEPIARLGGVTITSSDVAAAIADGRGARPGATADEIRTDVRNKLIAELWAEQVFADQARKDPALRSILDEAQRQVLFQLYAQSEFDPAEPTDAEIDAYIAAHPTFFSERTIFRAQTFRILPTEALDNAGLAELIAPLSVQPVTEQVTEGLAQTLAVNAIPFEQQNLWAGGEALPEGLRAHLHDMHETGRAVSVSTSPTLTEIVVLFSARSAPADPALVRDQIAARLVDQQFEAHTRALASRIASPIMEASNAGAPSPVLWQRLSMRLALATAVVAALLGLLGASVVVWRRQAHAVYRLARLESADDTLTVLQRTGPVTIFGGVALTVSAVTSVWAFSTRPALLSPPGFSIVVGLFLLGAGLGWLLWSRKADCLATASAHLRRSAWRSAALAILVVAGALAFWAYPTGYQ